MKISPARTAAFDILLRVETDGSYTSVLLPFYEKDLSNADRALCHELVLGTLRRQIWLDRVIDHLAKGKRLDSEVRVALRLGIHQLTHLSRVPAHSAVNESVNLVQRARKTSAKGFVNAILRRVTEAVPPLIYDDDIERLAFGTSHPRWLVERWIEQFGREQAEALLSANNEPGPTAFRIVRATAETHELVANAHRSENIVGCLTIEGGSGGLAALAARGLVYIQDEASQMVARCVRVPENGRVLDVCAAPGGKSGLIALDHSTAIVVAGDLHDHRVDLLRDSLRRQSVDNAAIVRHDAATGLPFAAESFDSVLVDVPCSGTGTIRRNPEIRYFLQPSDIVELASKQLRILIEASKLVKPGGLLIYSTCSLESEENEEVTAAFLERVRGFQTVKPDVPRSFLTERGFARTFPHRDRMDGFFIAAFGRARS